MLQEDPFGPGTKKLEGELKKFRRIRTGAIRVVYRVDENKREVRIIAVLPRGDVYKKL
ncbi:MAG: type II toxin-antitoxin system RelE/ParE family toxin [Deltaproteobacteria bacterium]|nr:type II toxin-antitoxin system RelE/ParE family toxin [Deltaproteobacteria bacterium]